MKDHVARPEATGSKINCYDEFELCYLRHKYIRRSTANPGESDIQPFLPIIKHCAKRTYFVYSGLFKSVGMEIEDVINIGKTHLVSYLGLYSVQDGEKKDKFIDRYIETHRYGPEEVDFLDKDKADFTLFLKQRMEDLVRVCRQKVRNIRGQLAEEYLVFYGNEMPPEDLGYLAKNYGKLGFRKLDVVKFKSLKKKMENSQDGPIFNINGLIYVTVPLDHRQLTLEDLSGAGMNPYDAIHNMTPEDIMIHNATEIEFQKKKKRWQSRSKNSRIKKIRDFIRANANNPRYSEEVKTARRLISE